MRACFALFAAIVSTAPVAGQPATAPVAPAPAPQDMDRQRLERQRQLEALGSEISTSTETLRRLQAEVETLKRDREALNRDLVQTARAVQRAESEITAAEARLRQLFGEEDRLRRSLSDRRAVIGDLLAALQRLGRNPPPALLVEPDSALAAIRSAILMGAVLPELRSEADRVVADLERLLAVRQQAAAEVEQRRLRLVALSDNRTRLELLAEEKRRAEQASAEEIGRTQARSEQLARDARSLQDLIRRMEQDIAAARRAAEEAQRAEAERERAAAARRQEEEQAAAALRQDPEPERRTVASLPNAARLAPALAFDRARGLLPLPASGDVIRTFGQDDGVGGSHRGLSIGTRAGATVTAPADGWIVYAGPFRSYGQLVIVNVGGGYHLLLAGMERITVTPGQFVLAGEPLAQMGQRNLSPATAIDMGSERPVLYVEFRKDGQTIDPAPWWAETAVEKARG